MKNKYEPFEPFDMVSMLLKISDMDFSMLPSHMADGFERYIFQGIPLGGFGECIVCNNFVGAAGRADDINRHSLFQYAEFLYHAPGCVWGSREAYVRWLESHALLKQDIEKTNKYTDALEENNELL